jgi:hypothetical protein
MKQSWQDTQPPPNKRSDETFLRYFPAEIVLPFIEAQKRSKPPPTTHLAPLPMPFNEAFQAGMTPPPPLWREAGKSLRRITYIYIY